jgi:hypothetical protein
MFFRNWLAAALALAIAGCAAPGGERIRAAPPPADYVYVSGGDTRGEKNLEVTVGQSTLRGGSERDQKLGIVFGFHFVASSLELRPKDQPTSGSGLSVTDSIRLTQATDPKTGLEDALNVLAHRKPGLRNLAGELYRSPGDRYVMLTRFDSDAGDGALYFDVTDWAINGQDY